MVKLIIFDLDGVLVDAKNIHYDALNKALGDDFEIKWDEHLSIYDGLKTNQKLEILTIKKGLPVERHKQIWEDKQYYTLNALKDLEKSKVLINCFEKLIYDG
jgi:beta-phosphoglucomutase-like phosphatase (HAD superfamily)